MMNQRMLLMIAAALTAFVLIVTGTLVAHFLPATDTASTAPAVSAAALDPSTEAAYRQRIAEYQAALEEANRRLALANQQLAEQSRAVGAGDATASYTVSPAQAQAIALAAAPSATLTKPAELVRYQGQLAYEVILDRGTLYIDAQSAAVLANGTDTGTTTAAQAAQAAISYRGGGTVREVELEREHGAVVYVVEFTDGGEVYVDATTGQVVYAQLDAHEDGDGDD